MNKMNQHTVKNHHFISRFSSSLGGAGKKVSGHKLLLGSLFLLRSNIEKKVFHPYLQKNMYQNKSDTPPFSFLLSLGFTEKAFQGFLNGLQNPVLDSNTLSRSSCKGVKGENETIKKQNDFSKNSNKLVKNTKADNKRVKQNIKTVSSQEDPRNVKTPFLTKALLSKIQEGIPTGQKQSKKQAEQALSSVFDVLKKDKKTFFGEGENRADLKNILLENKMVSERCRDNVKPIVETRKLRKGRVTYRVPFVTQTGRQEGKAIDWIIESSCSRKNQSKATSSLQRKEDQPLLLTKLSHDRKKKSRSLEYCLAEEFLDSFQGKGESIEKKKGFHKLALQNRAYTHFRWW